MLPGKILCKIRILYLKEGMNNAVSSIDCVAEYLCLLCAAK